MMSSSQNDQGAHSRVVPLRLQKFLARSGVASRRGSENLITAGRVRVNGKVVRELGSKVDPLHDEVSVDDQVVKWATTPVYLMLHKPQGYLSTMRDPRGRPTVAELVPCQDYPGLFCVGRLDKDTTGLLLFTTDGEVAQALLHPSQEKPKRYMALVQGIPTSQDLMPLLRGILLDDGPAAPAKVRLMHPRDALVAKAFSRDVPPGCAVVEITLHEGRKHQVKRMLKAVGYPVRALHRSSFGPLELGDLPQGAWRKLTDQEVAKLRALRVSS